MPGGTANGVNTPPILTNHKQSGQSYRRIYMEVGAKVTYKEINLSLSYRGTVAEIKDNNHCMVDWYRPRRVRSLEYTPNLREVDD